MNSGKDNSSSHPYNGCKAVLATMHGKQNAIERPLYDRLGISLEIPENLNTDIFGTFAGEIEREHSPIKTLRKKIKAGMELIGLPYGIGSEGSFGPHPTIPFVAGHHEVILWIDENHGIEIKEQLIGTRTNYDSKVVKSYHGLKDFLKNVRFPSHALIVRQNKGTNSEIFKGLKDLSSLKEAIQKCASASLDKKALVQTDMRAHMNPTRMKAIRRVTLKLVERMSTLCSECGSPGWGLIDVIKGLPCRGCGLPTSQVSKEVYGCSACTVKKKMPRKDGKRRGDPMYCQWCNP